MSRWMWQEVGWLRIGKDGEDYGFCEECDKWVKLNSVGCGEYESMECSICGEEVLGE